MPDLREQELPARPDRPNGRSAVDLVHQTRLAQPTVDRVERPPAPDDHHQRRRDHQQFVQQDRSADHVLDRQRDAYVQVQCEQRDDRAAVHVRRAVDPLQGMKRPAQVQRPPGEVTQQGVQPHHRDLRPDEQNEHRPIVQPRKVRRVALTQRLVEKEADEQSQDENLHEALGGHSVPRERGARVTCSAKDSGEVGGRFGDLATW